LRWPRGNLTLLIKSSSFQLNSLYIEDTDQVAGLLRGDAPWPEWTCSFHVFVWYHALNWDFCGFPESNNNCFCPTLLDYSHASYGSTGLWPSCLRKACPRPSSTHISRHKQVFTPWNLKHFVQISTIALISTIPSICIVASRGCYYPYHPWDDLPCPLLGPTVILYLVNCDTTRK